MAQRNSSGRGGTATGTKRQAGNRTPNTPQISETEISRMRVDDIRSQLRRYGVSGISALRKPELVKTLAKTLRSGGAARRSSGPAGRASATKAPAGTARKTTTAARKTTTAARKTTTAAQKSTVRKATAAGAKKAAPRKAAPKTTAARKSTTTRTAGSASARKSGGAARGPAKAAPARAAAKAAPTRGSGVRTGRSTARSTRSSQVISSLQDRPERPGRSLVTTNHEVIQRWARERGAKPATIGGTERDGRAGVLTFNIPGYRESSRIREITWDEWFHTFDLRRLNLIYQEQMRDGRQSNFFRTESPDREDA
ncbi:hypothetical protein GCM10011608_15220 [Micromonospora sonchi]|uniref:Rho termination factor N-terminal domain-containing protein n=2 Tax=Micromonospora sonchi TaxID=1763543 RepID=A0A917WUN8_9ACTN|nr:hypothetical protein [Micromonospora sonchi]GGM31567.1 hypothetical protein GCM10011608_15220 [Micromonospora sonchi]